MFLVINGNVPFTRKRVAGESCVFLLSCSTLVNLCKSQAIQQELLSASVSMPCCCTVLPQTLATVHRLYQLSHSTSFGAKHCHGHIYVMALISCPCIVTSRFMCHCSIWTAVYANSKLSCSPELPLQSICMAATCCSICKSTICLCRLEVSHTSGGTQCRQVLTSLGPDQSINICSVWGTIRGVMDNQRIQ